MDGYLIWIGAEHYPTIESFTTEAQSSLGLSRRMPSLAVAEAVMGSKSPVWTAHDEGGRKPCPSCSGAVDCPQCRKIDTLIARAKVGLGRLEGSKVGVKRIKRIDNFEEMQKNCKLCSGTGKTTSGTGGRVTLKDGRVWDYRQYTYWRNRCSGKGRARFDYERDVAELAMCETCGGRGELPTGRIFGVFIPEAIEYIERGDETAEFRKALEGKGVRWIETRVWRNEARRGCGKRIPGGFYVVASKGPKAKPGEVSVAAAFFELGPFRLNGKRFRGVKRHKAGERVARATEMILESME